MEAGTMKITRRQLKDFIKEELALSDDSVQKAVDAVKDTMDDGEADVADAKAAAEEATGTEMGDEDFEALAQDAGLSTTTVNKVVAAEGARTKISKAKIRQIIKEEVANFNKPLN